MKKLLNEFIAFCNLANITPAEKEIDGYLRKEKVQDREITRNFLIRFCFYHWERRNEKDYIDELLNNQI